jgi:hypothetical protein
MYIYSQNTVPFVANEPSWDIIGMNSTIMVASEYMREDDNLGDRGVDGE